MQITNVETIPVEVPVMSLDKEYGVGPYVSGSRLESQPRSASFEEALAANNEATVSGKKLLIRLETDAGITGWGEMKVPTMRTGATIVDELIAPALIGRNIWEMEGFVEQFKTFPSAYYTDITSFVGGAEMAMWDALGKYLGEPVHRLIGGKRVDEVPISYCLGLLSPEESRAPARFARDAGFNVLKTKGSRYWRADVERIKAMHDEVDGDLEFRLDPNQLWSLEDAVRVGAELEREGIFLQYMEQPIRVDEFGTLKRLRERLQTPIAINEDAYFPRNLYLAGKEDAIDAAVVDVVPAGGILGLKRLAGVASDMGISITHHSNFDLGIKVAAKLHVLSSTPAFNMPFDSIYYAYEDTILKNDLEVTDGAMVVPDEPGLAGEIDESKIEEYRLD